MHGELRRASSTRIHAYPHDGESAAVTGGPVYRAGMFPPEYQGDLFFGDYARGFIKTAHSTPTATSPRSTTSTTQAGSVVDLKVAPDGSLYYLTYFPGALYRVSYNTTSHLPVASRLRRRHQGRRAAHGALLQRREPATPTATRSSYRWTFGDGTTSTARTRPRPTRTRACTRRG